MADIIFYKFRNWKLFKQLVNIGYISYKSVVWVMNGYDIVLNSDLHKFIRFDKISDGKISITQL